MTEEQSRELLNHLVSELNTNGFSFVVEEILLRLEEDFEQKEVDRGSRQVLMFYLNEAIEIIKNHSNNNYDNLIGNLNEYLTQENKVKMISVELYEKDSTQVYNLADLPDYSELVDNLNNVRNEIFNEPQ
ncbi:MAG TPA: hypothetical protein DCX41_12510 [Aequorivita sp.]|nr:hypothetical protein [Aequorivita sp.]HBL80439.1 hypothetical protein [Aequorivita sp.]|tara:strand:+ start:2665 stop:3054 length:390 start_codon:yes stop_codon:yes gene_type:complete